MSLRSIGTSGWPCAGRELYAPAELGAKVILAGAVIFLIRAFGYGGKPCASGGRGHEQLFLGTPERAALAVLAHQIRQQGMTDNSEALMTSGGTDRVNVFYKSWG